MAETTVGSGSSTISSVAPRHPELIMRATRNSPVLIRRGAILALVLVGIA